MPQFTQKATDVRRNLGNRIRTLRRERGWSQQRLSRESRLSRSSLWAIERGAVDLGVKTLCKLADAFEITLSELVKDIDDLEVTGKRRPAM